MLRIITVHLVFCQACCRIFWLACNSIACQNYEVCLSDLPTDLSLQLKSQELGKRHLHAALRNAHLPDLTVLLPTSTKYQLTFLSLCLKCSQNATKGECACSGFHIMSRLHCEKELKVTGTSNSTIPIIPTIRKLRNELHIGVDLFSPFMQFWILTKGVNSPNIRGVIYTSLNK